MTPDGIASSDERAEKAVDEDEAAPPRFGVEERLDRAEVGRRAHAESGGPERLARDGRDVRILPVLLVGHGEARLLEALESALAQAREPRRLAVA